MFEHVELVIPPTNRVEAAVEVVMRHVTRRRDGWCDFYFVGGAWNGTKQLLKIDLKPFEKRLREMQITVSIVRWNGSRPILNPESQAAAIDAEWRRFYPGLSESCPLFAPYRGPLDINWCSVADIPENLEADRVVVGNHLRGRRIMHMLDQPAMEKVDYAVLPAIRSLQTTTPGKPSDDWLVVTLCCHW